MTWIDLLLVLCIAGCTALAAHRRTGGLVVGIGGLVLLQPLLWIASQSAPLALVLATFAGLGLGVAGRILGARMRLGARNEMILGAAGGFLLSSALVLALVSGLPIARDLNNRLLYPAPGLPLGVQRAVQDSHLVGIGRDIVLYPLLDSAGQVAPERRAILKGLHGMLVVGRPWEGGGN